MSAEAVWRLKKPFSNILPFGFGPRGDSAVGVHAKPHQTRPGDNLDVGLFPREAGPFGGISS